MKASAVVLIEAERTAMSTLGPVLATLPGVTRVWSVAGEWDFVLTVDVTAHSDLGPFISATLGRTEGVARTQTLVALDTHEGKGGTA